jgi:ketosteroid isomerase-like protein
VRSRILYVSALLAVLAIAACAPSPAPTTGTAADEAAIRAVGPAYAEAWNRADVPALLTFSVDDYEGVRPDGKVLKGKAAVEADLKESAAARAGLPLKLSVDTSFVRWTSGTSATAAGTWTLAGLPAGMGGDKGAWTSTVVKGADGKWRMVTGLVAEFVPPPAAPAAPPTGKSK